MRANTKRTVSVSIFANCERKDASENSVPFCFRVSCSASTAKTEGEGDPSSRQDKKQARTFLSPAEQRPILLETKVDIDKVGARKELHDHSRGNDGCDTEFHERSTVGCEDYTHPVQWVRRVGGHDSVQRHLRAYQENKQCYGCPKDFLVERDL